MATKYLRKIILEELRKVLREVDYLNIPGAEPGQIQSEKSSDSEMTPAPLGVKDKSWTRDVRGDDLGPCVNQGDPGCRDPEFMKKLSKCGSGYDPKCQPSILKLQKELNYFAKVTNSPRIKEDGIAGKNTNILFQKATGRPLSYANLKDPLSFKETLISLRDYTNQLMTSQISSLEKDIQGIDKQLADISSTRKEKEDKKAIRKKLAPTTIGGVFIDPETGEPTKTFQDDGKEDEKKPFQGTGELEEALKKEITKLLKRL